MLKSDIDSFFRIVDKTITIEISGGEPFICTTKKNFSLGQVLDYICHKYPTRFDKIRIFTNGTIPPNDDICEVFQRINKPLHILIDDYGILPEKLLETVEKLKSIGLSHSIRDYKNDLHCEGWIDFINVSLKHDKTAANEVFNKCAVSKHLGAYNSIIDGMLAVCCPIPVNRYLHGEIEKDHVDVIDLHGDKEKMRKKLASIIDAKQPFDSCSYCSGGYSKDSERFIPAQQATENEISEYREMHPKIRY
jgi:hypothetical protein